MLLQGLSQMLHMTESRFGEECNNHAVLELLNCKRYVKIWKVGTKFAIL